MKSFALLFKRVFCFIAVGTLALEPLASANMQLAMNDQNLREFLKSHHLDKGHQTVGEFFKTLEKELPERINADVRPWIEAHGNEKMPTLDVSKFKDVDGKQKIRLTLSQGSEVVSMALLGEDERFVKYGNVTLVLEDVLKFRPMIERIDVARPKPSKNSASKLELRGDVKNPENVSSNQKSNRPRDEYRGIYVLPKFEEFKKLTPQQRAELVVRLRNLWSTAKEAEFQIEKVKPAAKTSVEYKVEVFHDLFFLALLGQVAQAGPNGPYYVQDSNACIDSGWLGEHKAGKCESKEKDEFKSWVSTNAPGAKCPSGGGFCNPAIYGYDRSSGNPICSASAKDRKNATHFDGPCDKQSRLSGNTKPVADLEINPNDLFGNDAKQKALADSILKADGANIKAQSQEMISMILSKGISYAEGTVDKMSKDQIAAIFSGKASEDQLKPFYAVVKGFYSDINASLEACSQMPFDKSPKKVLTLTDPAKIVASGDTTQQLGACRQLWRRKLAFDIYVNQFCAERGVALKHKAAGPLAFDPEGSKCEAVVLEGVGTGVGVGTGAGAKCSEDQDAILDDKKVPTGECLCKNPPKEKVKAGEKCKNEKPVSGAVAGACKKPNIKDSEKFDEKTCKCKNGKDPVGEYCEPKVAPPKPVEPVDVCEKDNKSFGEFYKCHQTAINVAGALVLTGLTLNLIRRQTNRVDQNPTDPCPTTAQTCPGVLPNKCTSPLVYNFSTSTCMLPCGALYTPNYQTLTCDPITSTTPVCSPTTTGTCMCNTVAVANYQACVGSVTCSDGRKVSNVSQCRFTCPNSTLVVDSPAQCPVAATSATGASQKMQNGAGQK